MRPEMMPDRWSGAPASWLRRDMQVLGLPVPFVGVSTPNVGEKGVVELKTKIGLAVDEFLREPADVDCLPAKMHYEITGDCSLRRRLERADGSIDLPLELRDAVEIERDPYARRAGFWIADSQA